MGEELSNRGVAVNQETLVLRDVVVSDRGVYVCTVENNAGTSRGSAVLEVDRR